MKMLVAYAGLSLLLMLNGVAKDVSDAALKKVSIIKHYVDDEERHHYHIPVAYSDADERIIKDLVEYNKEIIKVVGLTKKDGFHFVTSKELNEDELIGVFQYVAFAIGKVPSWVELIQLSRPKAKSYPSDVYTVTTMKKIDMDNMLKAHDIALTDFTPIKRNCSGMYFPMNELRDRTLILNSRAAKCSGHDNYSLRIINDKGEVTWQDLEALGGDIRFLRVNIDDDDMNETLFYQNDHFVESLVILDSK